MKNQLPIPDFYNADNAGKWNYRANQQTIFEEAVRYAERQKIKPAVNDRKKIHLLLIDLQKDFCFPEGNLYVAGRNGIGAIEDNKRIAQFIYRNLDKITEITTTMDTHFAFQIFFAPFWVDQNDRPLQPNTAILVEDIRAGKYLPNPAIAKWLCNGNYGWLVKQVEFYCEELQKAGKYTLFLWPPHCILGDEGQALAGVIQEARMFQAYARNIQSWVEIKGGNPLTENYSVLRPEVLLRWDGNPLAQKNTLFLKKLFEADTVIIAGQAASHCVKSSIDDLLNEIVAQDPAQAKKVYIMEDCMSAVTIPDGKGGFFLDFTKDAEEALDRFRQAGMNVVKAVDQIENWPGINL